MAVMETLFDFYAIRELEINLVSAVSTSGTGNLAIAVTSGPIEDDTFKAGGLSQQQILEHQCSCAGSTGVPMALLYKYHGTKLFVTTSRGSPAIADYIQAYFFASAISIAASTTYGTLVVKGVVDFYCNTEINTNPVLEEDRIWRRFTYQKWLTYAHSPGYDGISALEFHRRYKEPLRNKALRDSIVVKPDPRPFEVEEKKA
jgi:uncharacterized protein YqkB